MRFFVFLIILSSCCSSSFDFNKEDMEFSADEKMLIDSFTKGEILYYKNDLGDVDTIKVVAILDEFIEGGSCFISREPSNNYHVEINHLPNDIYTGKNFHSDNNSFDITYQWAISITKHPLDKRVNYSFNFKDFYLETDSINNFFKEVVNIKGNVFNECYHLKKNNIGVNEFIWNRKNGLVAYSDGHEIWLKL